VGDRRVAHRHFFVAFDGDRRRLGVDLSGEAFEEVLYTIDERRAAGVDKLPDRFGVVALVPVVCRRLGQRGILCVSRVAPGIAGSGLLVDLLADLPAPFCGIPDLLDLLGHVSNLPNACQPVDHAWSV
jgi:hypothetical protein